MKQALEWPAWRAGLRILAAAGLVLLAGCSTPTPQDYRAQGPVLDISQYFSDKVVGHGLVTDRSGRVLRRFTVHIQGRWQGDTGVLEEDFKYADGATERRLWRLQRLSDGRWSGRADDIVGEALGQADGNAVNWRYTLRVPVGARTWDLQFDDWMFLIDDRVMINRAVMTKFGIRMGEVTLTFRKQTP